MKKPQPGTIAGSPSRAAAPARPVRRESHWAKPALYLALGVFVILLLGTIFRVGIGFYNQQLLATGLTADTRPVRLAIATETLSVPANMLRQERTRAGGPVERAELVIHWPTLEGYSERMAEAFKEGAPSAPVIYATITARDGPMDATARLDAVYARFFVGKALPAPEGLAGRALSADLGYGREIVYFAPNEPRPFVARCMADSTPEVPATCLRDVNFGRSLSLLYRFNHDMLGEWRDLDAAMKKLAAGFLTQ